VLWLQPLLVYLFYSNVGKGGTSSSCPLPPADDMGSLFPFHPTLLWVFLQLSCRSRSRRFAAIPHPVPWRHETGGGRLPHTEHPALSPPPLWREQMREPRRGEVSPGCWQAPGWSSEPRHSRTAQCRERTQPPRKQTSLRHGRAQVMKSISIQPAPALTPQQAIGDCLSICRKMIIGSKF